MMSTMDLFNRRDEEPGRNTANRMGDREVVGNFILDRLGRRALLAGREIPLRRREFDLLSFFFAHPGRVLDHDTLFKEVWGRACTADPRTIYVHVGWLRQKFRSKAPFHIQTVRSAGYRFDLEQGDEAS